MRQLDRERVNEREREREFTTTAAGPEEKNY
jgi:hypothetical protein